MLGRTYEDQNCSVARTLEVVGERWTLLIVRDVLNGTNRFDGLLRSLGIARNVLSDRLNRLVEHGVLVRVPYRERPLRMEYRPTDSGRELAVVVVAMMQWGDRHANGGASPPRAALHSTCDHEVTARLVCDHCARTAPVTEIVTRPNPAT